LYTENSNTVYYAESGLNRIPSSKNPENFINKSNGVSEIKEGKLLKSLY